LTKQIRRKKILTSIQEESTQEKGFFALFLCLIEDYEDLQFLLKGLIPFIVLASALDSPPLYEIEIWNSGNGDFLPT
jgi:hypothetical protein